MSKQLHKILKQFSAVQYQRKNFCPPHSLHELIDVWAFSFGNGGWGNQKEWQASKLSQLLLYVKEWYTMDIEFRVIGNISILKTIENIKFPFLRRLKVLTLTLQSVESLSRIEMEMLETLDLGGNQICSVKTLRKCSIPQLKALSLGFNPIVDSQYLSQLEQPICSAFRTSTKGSDDLRWITKLHSSELRAFRFDDLERDIDLIPQHHWRKALSKKYQYSRVSWSFVGNQSESEYSQSSVDESENFDFRNAIRWTEDEQSSEQSFFHSAH